MKKILGIVAVIATAAMLMSCASTQKAEPAKKEVAAAPAVAPEHGVIYSGDITATQFIIADNHTYGKNYQCSANVLPGDYVAKTGDVIKIHFEGTTNKALVVGPGDKADEPKRALLIRITDTSAAANYWTELTDQAKWFFETKDLAAGSSFKYDMEFPIVKDATGKASGATANLIIGSGNSQKEAAILKVKKMTYEIVRP